MQEINSEWPKGKSYWQHTKILCIYFCIQKKNYATINAIWILIVTSIFLVWINIILYCDPVTMGIKNQALKHRDWQLWEYFTVICKSAFVPTRKCFPVVKPDMLPCVNTNSTNKSNGFMPVLLCSKMTFLPLWQNWMVVFLMKNLDNPHWCQKRQWI